MKNKYLILFIRKKLNCSTKTKYFTKLNIVVVFNKIKISENEKSKTVFRIKYGFFALLIMNFGFCGILSTSQNYINDILHEYLNIFCSAYIDDIFIYNKTKQKHAKHIRLMFYVRDLVKEVKNDRQGMFRRLLINIYVLGKYTRRTTKS